MKYIIVAGLAAITLAAIVIARRRDAQCPWSTADARRIRDEIDIPDPMHAYQSMFWSLDQRRDG